MDHTLGLVECADEKAYSWGQYTNQRSTATSAESVMAYLELGAKFSPWQKAIQVHAKSGSQGRYADKLSSYAETEGRHHLLEPSKSRL